MSLRAILWVIHDAPVDDPAAFAVLIALADPARDDGTAAWLRRPLHAQRARCSVSTLKRRLGELRDAGLIALGDQRIVEHIRPDRRPNVWNLLIHGPLALPADVTDSDDDEVNDQADSAVVTVSDIASESLQPVPRGVSLNPREQPRGVNQDATGGQPGRHGGSLVTHIDGPLDSPLDEGSARAAARRDSSPQPLVVLDWRSARCTPGCDAAGCAACSRSRDVALLASPRPPLRCQVHADSSAPPACGGCARLGEAYRADADRRAAAAERQRHRDTRQADARRAKATPVTVAQAATAARRAMRAAGPVETAGRS